MKKRDRAGAVKGKIIKYQLPFVYIIRMFVCVRASNLIFSNLSVSIVRVKPKEIFKNVAQGDMK